MEVYSSKIKKKKKFFCSSFTIYRRDRRSFAGGLLIANQNSCFSELVILPDFISVYNIEFLAVNIEFTSQTIFLTCSYIPPQSKSDIYIQHSEAIAYISSLTSECDQLELF